MICWYFCQIFFFRQAMLCFLLVRSVYTHERACETPLLQTWWGSPASIVKFACRILLNVFLEQIPSTFEIMTAPKIRNHSRQLIEQATKTCKHTAHLLKNACIHNLNLARACHGASSCTKVDLNCTPRLEINAGTTCMHSVILINCISRSDLYACIKEPEQARLF